MTDNERSLLLQMAAVVAGLAYERDLLRAREVNTSTTMDGADFARKIMAAAEAVRQEA